MSAPEPAGDGAEEVTHRGIRWRRVRSGRIGWYDEERSKWVMWRPGRDAPPRPPGWERPGGRGAMAGGPVSRSRPPWRSGFRLVPIALAVAAVLFALFQVLRPSGNPVKAETSASAKLLGKCLAQHGTAAGHPKYSVTPVPCGSAAASVKVVQVIPTGPGITQTCPAGTTGFQIPYVGVSYPHVECLRPVPGRR
ncbi:MAG: LppU/SCO3897 family protein [Acidimicrobiales bacterium]